MNYAAVVLTLLVAGCSGSSPTAPTPPAAAPPSAPVIVVPPTPSTPPDSAPPTPSFPPSDTRFDVTFYRQFVHDGFEHPAQLVPLRRQAEAPRIYLRTIVDDGVAVDARTLDRVAAALENTAGSLTGIFGLAGLERGTSTREWQRGWITVRWAAQVDPNACGRAPVGGGTITLYPRTPGCRCDGLDIALRTVKHELGHALGFWHTGVREDLMAGIPDGQCDAEPSARERYHAAIAYTRPIGSAAP